MEDYPGNSKTPPRRHEKPEKKAAEKPKLEAIVTTPAQRRKTPLGKRIRATFFGGDTRSVGGYVLSEVLIPAMKDTITDVVTQGVERMVFGESSHRSRGRSVGNRNYTSYNRMSGNTTIRREPRDDPRPQISRQARARHDFDEIALGSRAEANGVLDQMYVQLSKYEQVSVADLYSLVDISGTYQDEKWGWESLEGARVHHSRGAYVLDLPRPEPLS